MRNNCDVSGTRTLCSGDMALCTFGQVGEWGFCIYRTENNCTSTAAIRAAIEAERGIEYLTTARQTNDMEHSTQCPKCGATKEFNGEPDTCLGFLPGVVDACCGHGDRSQAYVHFQNGVVIEGFTVGEKINEPDGPELWVLNDAAIEAEHIVDANKMMARDCENCKHAEGPAMKGPCENCVVMQNWEPADAWEKGE